jgi:arginyl-tRNA synthetase
MSSPHSSLQDQLSALQLNTDIPDFPDSYPERNPIDIYRCFISEKLAQVSGVDAKTIYPTLQWTQTLDRGDLNLAIPRLRLKGSAPNKIAQQWAEAVSTIVPLKFQEGEAERTECF